MKKIFFIVTVAMLLIITGCDKNIDIDDIDNAKTKTFSGINQSNIISNDEITDDDNDEILAQTFLLDFMQTGREFKSGFIHDDTLQIILLSKDSPSEEFELFNQQTPSTTLAFCDVLGIKTIILKLVDKSENPIFEITYTNNETKYMISPDYVDLVK